MKKITLAAFIITALIQWAVPGKMIFDTERILRDGSTFKFEIRPVDPSDPFRGKYITLNFEVNPFQTDTLRKIKSGQEVFVKLGTDDRGFVRITALYTEEPADLSGILKTKVEFTTKFNRARDTDTAVNYVHFRFPFEKYYLEESKAAEAERLAWRPDTTHVQTFYAVVKIKNGASAIQDVMVNDRSLSDIVREINDRKAKEKANSQN